MAKMRRGGKMPKIKTLNRKSNESHTRMMNETNNITQGDKPFGSGGGKVLSTKNGRQPGSAKRNQSR